MICWYAISGTYMVRYTVSVGTLHACMCMYVYAYIWYAVSVCILHVCMFMQGHTSYIDKLAIILITRQPSTSIGVSVTLHIINDQMCMKARDYHL